jgi:transglutaminase-like putative cysteine protease
MNGRLTLATAAATILASTALYSLFAGQTWFWAGAGATLVVAGTGALTRLRPLPVIVCLAASLAALLLYLNAVFAASRSWLLVLPTASSLSHLRQVALLGTADADRFAPPVPSTPGLILLAAGGIGLAAVATDMLGARLRGPAVAGLPLVALFTVPTTTSVSRNPVGTAIVFALGVIGYLLILGVDSRERIRLWGRTVTLWGSGTGAQPTAMQPPGVTRPPDAGSLGSAGRRVGIASMVVALCVPLLVPGLQVTRLFPVHINVLGPAGNLGTSGGATVPDPLAAMNDDLHESQPVPVLTYHSTDPTPQYLQMYVLGNLATSGWTIGPRLGPTISAGGKLPVAPGLTGAARYAQETTHVTFSRSAASATAGVSFLPVPYPPTRVSAAGPWQVDSGTSMVFSVGTPLSGLGYTVTSSDVDPAAQQLNRAAPPPAAIAGEYLSVPVSFRSLKQLADKVTRSPATGYGKAIALQQWFTQTGGFSYSLTTTEPASAAGLTQFLTVTKRGYCQQFAFAMAVMARLLGIPSRVAVGFTAGTPTGIDSWVVKTSDAHAWPELYFQGAGWLRFEPTPAGAGGQGTAVPPTYSVPVAPGAAGTLAPATAPGNSGTGSSGTKSGSTAISPQLRVAGGGNAGSGHRGSGGGFPWEPIGVPALVLAALLAAPGAGRSALRRRRLMLVGGPSPGDCGDGARAHAAWREFLDDLTDYRIGWRPSESPRAIGRRITSELHLPSGPAEALARLALAEERASYAGTPGPAATLRPDMTIVRRGIAASAGRRARWEAQLFPASVLAALRAGAAQATDSAAARTRPRSCARPELTDRVAGPAAR